MEFPKGKSILLTGATGSIGKTLVRELLKSSNFNRIVIFSRDEFKQSDFKKNIGSNDKLRWFLGDIRDLDRLSHAMKDIDYVVHLAGLRQIESSEYNPFEVVKTNIIGSQNVISAAVNANVKKVLTISADKASNPINIYGATKLVTEKLFQSSNYYAAGFNTKFSAIRFGNILSSRSSVIPLWETCAFDKKPIPITDFRMTRFWLTLDFAAKYIQNALEIMMGGEIFVPIVPSLRLLDLATAIAPESQTIEVGIRPGEKLHETLVSLDESRNAIKYDNYIILKPLLHEMESPLTGEPLPEGFSFTSNEPNNLLSISDIRTLLDLNS